jgi:hypothetical protein
LDLSEKESELLLKSHLAEAASQPSTLPAEDNSKGLGVHGH